MRGDPDSKKRGGGEKREKIIFTVYIEILDEKLPIL